MLDEDYNASISKVDIFRFLMQNRRGYRVYPQNVTRAVELYAVKRGDKIEFIEFSEMVSKNCQFIVFPAFRLQSIMIERFGGYTMWNYINKRLVVNKREDDELAERDKYLKRSE